MDNNEKLEHSAGYFDGELPEEILRKLEQEHDNSEDFHGEVAIQKNVSEFLKSNYSTPDIPADKLASFKAEIRSKLDQPKVAKGSFGVKKFLALAASIMIIIGAVFVARSLMNENTIPVTPQDTVAQRLEILSTDYVNPDASIMDISTDENLIVIVMDNV